MKSTAFIGFLLTLTIGAEAYVGPGLGAGTLGVIAGLILSVFVAVFAVVWYPIKRLLGLGTKAKRKSAAEHASK